MRDYQNKGLINGFVKVINMDMKDDNEMQKVLVQNLKRGKKIGLRGEMIETARHLYILTQKVLSEMKSKGNSDEGSDYEIDVIFDINQD